jgi:Asp-tRNA(Asn)/Glu-tRNA(Gln) amidotransferase B subunit
MAIDSIYDDTCIVVKYGRTKDLIRRTKEHEKTYNVIPNVNIEMLHYLYIDSEHCVNAENMLKEYFEEHMVIYKQHKELAVLDTKAMKHLYDRFLHVKEKCSQKTECLNRHIQLLKNDLKNAQMTIDMLNTHSAKYDELISQMRLDNESTKAEHKEMMTKMVKDHDERVLLINERNQMEVEKHKIKNELEKNNHDLIVKNLRLELELEKLMKGT